MFSGTVRSNLDPFGEYGADAILWEAVRDVGLEEQVRAARGLQGCVAAGQAGPGSGCVLPGGGAVRVLRMFGRHSSSCMPCLAGQHRLAPSPDLRLPPGHARRSRRWAAWTPPSTPPTAPGPWVRCSWCAWPAPR